jgi:hypothetical protein
MKDMLSNELAVGDCVHVKFGNEWIGGVVVKLHNGGLSLGIANPTQKNGAPQLTADVVVLQVTIPLGGHPGQPQPLVVRLDTKGRTEEIVESTIKM